MSLLFQDFYNNMNIFSIWKVNKKVQRLKYIYKIVKDEKNQFYWKKLLCFRYVHSNKWSGKNYEYMFFLNISWELLSLLKTKCDKTDCFHVYNNFFIVFCTIFVFRK